MGNKPKKFDFVYQTVSHREARAGGAQDCVYISHLASFAYLTGGGTLTSHYALRRKDGTEELLGLAVKEPWLAPSEPIHTQVAQTGLENATPTFWAVHLWQGRRLGL